MTNKEIREKARELLSDNWGIPILLTFILFVVKIVSLFVLMNIPILGQIISVFLTSAILLGYAIFYLNFKRNKKPAFEDGFQGFNNIFKPTGVNFFIGLFIFIFNIPFIILYVISIAYIFMSFQNSNPELFYYLNEKYISPTQIFQLFNDPTFTKFIIITAIFVIINTIIDIIIKLRYAQVFYIIADDPSIYVFDCLKKGAGLMKGNTKKLLLLYLSFAGWYLLSILTCGFGFLFLIPYINTSTAIFYDDISGYKKPDEDNPTYDDLLAKKNE